jgi:ATP-dependent RNA helicase RhlE
VDVLIATPGRLLDHMSAGFIRLDHVETVVLDEADQMLDLGFLEPIKRIVAALPARRQSLFFSATMPKEIAGLAGKFLHNPVTVSVAPAATTVERVEQRAILIETGRKRELLVELLGDPAIARALVFTRTKHGADKVARHLEAARIDAAAIHGNKSQGQREKALADFKAGRARVLVATDIAARGIDVDGVTHVINFDLPNVPESYVHRIGRTARAGAAGIAISFCDREERAYLRDIEKLIRQTVPTTDRRIPGAPEEAAPKPRQHNGHRHGHRHGEHGRGGHGHGEHGHGGHGRGGHGHGEHGHGAHGHDGHGHGHGHGERAHGRGGRHQGGERRGGPGHGGKGHGPRAAADHRPQGLKPRPRFGLSHG